MRMQVLALDYDGTIANGGTLDPDVRAALVEAHSSDVTVILVTGRIVEDLVGAAGDLSFADAVVAENGAVIAFPGNGGRSIALSEAPPSDFVQALRAMGFHADIGESVVAARASIASDVLGLIRARELPLALVFNGESLMVLPQSVSKRTGLHEALRLLGQSRHDAVGIGDRENDHELLASCALGAAVAWGSEPLKARAQVVIDGTGPSAVAAFVRNLVRNPAILRNRLAPHFVRLGRAAARAGSLAIRGGNVLVAGDRGSGTSWVAGLICEHLILDGYCTCVIDHDGSHRVAASLPDVHVVGGGRPLPTAAEAAETFDRPGRSVIVDLSGTGGLRRSTYVSDLLRTLASERRRTGWPHWIVVDPFDDSTIRPDDAEAGGYVLACRHPVTIAPYLWSTFEAAVATRTINPNDLERMAEGLGQPGWEQQRLSAIEHLLVGEAAILSQSDQTSDTPTNVQLAKRLNPPVHRPRPRTTARG